MSPSQRPRDQPIQRRAGAVADRVQVNRARRPREFVGHQNLVRPLKNLKRIRHVRGARNAGHEALDFRIALEPVVGVLLLLRERPGLVRDLVALDHACASGHTADGAERTDRRSRQVGGVARTSPGMPVRGGAGMIANAGRAGCA